MGRMNRTKLVPMDPAPPVTSYPLTAVVLRETAKPRGGVWVRQLTDSKS